MNTRIAHSGLFVIQHGQKYIKLHRELNLITSYYLAQFLRYEYPTSVILIPSKARVPNCFPSSLVTWNKSSSKIVQYDQ